MMYDVIGGGIRWIASNVTDSKWHVNLKKTGTVTAFPERFWSVRAVNVSRGIDVERDRSVSFLIGIGISKERADELIRCVTAAQGTSIPAVGLVEDVSAQALVSYEVLQDQHDNNDTERLEVSRGDESARVEYSGHYATETEDTEVAEGLLERLQEICEILTEICGFKVRDLREILCPTLLDIETEDLRKHVMELLTVYTSAHQLRKAVKNDVCVLDTSYLPEVKRFCSSLKMMGFSEEQTASILCEAPSVAKLKRFELQKAMKTVGISLPMSGTKESDNSKDVNLLKELVSKRPKECFLSPLPGNDKLLHLLRFLGKKGKLSKEDAVVSVSKCKSVLNVPVKELEIKFALLESRGLTKSQIGEVLKEQPEGILKCSLDQFQDTMEMLDMYGFRGSEPIIQYPRCFVHLPMRVIGPRLSYLKKYKTERLSKLSLGTILARGDDQFVMEFVDGNKEFYDNWRTNFSVEWNIRKKALPCDVGKKHTKSTAEVVHKKGDGQQQYLTFRDTKKNYASTPKETRLKHKSKSNPKEFSDNKLEEHNSKPSKSPETEKLDEKSLVSRRELRRRQFWQQRRSKQLGKFVRGHEPIKSSNNKSK